MISCSETGLKTHSAAGYFAPKLVVVHNGYDLDGFSPEAVAELQLRENLTIPSDCLLLGMIARWDPQKDHESLCKALQEILSSGDERWRCVLFGGNMEGDNTELTQLIDRYGLAEKLIPCGLTDNMPGVMAQLDVKVLSSSFGEAFPNVLNEAMACEVPCVATNVGDTAKIIGDCGWVSEPSDAPALAANIRQAMQEARHEPQQWKLRRQRCRERIVAYFTVEKMIRGYHGVWTQNSSEKR